MPRILVLYHSTYGHVEAMAEAVAEGARSVEGAEVDIRRVPELVPEELAKKSGYKLDQAAPIAKVDELGGYDAIIVGAGTRYGTAASQMRNFLDQTGGLWMNGDLAGKIGSAIVSTATQHGGNELTYDALHTFMLHHGMAITGLPGTFPGFATMGVDVASGCGPYGASTITGSDGSRMPSELELAGAKFQGEHVAKLAAKLIK